MRLVCLHADTVDALKRLQIEFDDLTPSGLWSSQYHLVGLTPEQLDALELFHVEAEDITPAPLVHASGQRPKGAEREATAGGSSAVSATRAGTATDAEVPLAQASDAGAGAAEMNAGTRADSNAAGKAAAQLSAQAASVGGGAQTAGAQGAAQKGGGKGGAPTAPATQANRKGQPPQGPTGGGQRYGTTRLRISVAGKYTEATVANGKIVIGSRAFDSPDQAAAELTKSRGDWTFWEYYDSTDGKWRMLTRDWDTVLKSAAPGGR
jgi:hypothetical protein